MKIILIQQQKNCRGMRKSKYSLAKRVQGKRETTKPSHDSLFLSHLLPNTKCHCALDYLRAIIPPFKSGFALPRSYPHPPNYSKPFSFYFLLALCNASLIPFLISLISINYIATF